MFTADSPFPLRPARMHEVCGAGATGFAALMAQARHGPVLWVREGWQGDRLHPLGLQAFMDPARLLVAQTPSQTDSLAVAEEALKDGALALVVVEITAPWDLRGRRRLQLAAHAGQIMGLCPTPQGTGSNATETRWHAAALNDSAPLQWGCFRWKAGRR